MKVLTPWGYPIGLPVVADLPALQQRELSEFVAEKMGLHFPPERWPDLERGLAGAATEFGFENVAACADRLLSAPLTRAQLQTLATHLTIGETYFFREKPTFEVLAQRVLPELIRSRRGREQRLRLWSAGSCSGEEAYSLAVLLRQLLPDLADWQVTILATDINPHFLRKAAVGSYGEWSFRDAPANFKERYFHRNEAGRYVIAPRIKAMVTIAHLNLVEDGYPSLATDTNAMDLILCRNVLMYFTPAQARRVVGKLHHALLGGGWLAVSPCEAAQDLFPPFATRNFPGVVLFQKREATFGPAESQPASPPPGGQRAPASSPEPPAPAAAQALTEPPAPAAAQALPAPAVPPPPTPYEVAAALYARGRDAEAAETLLASGQGSAAAPAACSLLARALANQAKLAEALTWCDRWIAADKVDPAGHYLRAVILLEQGAREEARRTLQRVIYLQPHFVLAHFALGNLSRHGGANAAAERHFANALHLLARLPPDTGLPESDGLTAARLHETITALLAPEGTP